jgi:tryptophanyl-tRNA synthetase
MSKSESSPLGTILVFDEPDAIARKVRRAVTDTDGEVRFDPATKPGVSNLLEILGSLRSEDPREAAARYASYGELKEDLAQVLVETLGPIKERRDELLGDTAAVRTILEVGAERARSMASKKYAQAAAAMGLLAP